MPKVCITYCICKKIKKGDLLDCFKEKKIWVRKIVRNRSTYGAYHTVFQELEYDKGYLFKYT